MMSLLASLENSGFATWVRESPSLLAYPLFIVLHTIGLGLLVGVSAGIALRILGFAPLLPLRPMERFFPIMWLGFWINALSGVVLLAAGATSFLTNPTFYVKLAAIALAVANLRRLRTAVFSDPASLGTNPVPMRGKILAGTLLTFWAIAITAGRVTSYSGSVPWETAGAVLIVAVVMFLAGYVAARLLGLRKPSRQGVTTPIGY